MAGTKVGGLKRAAQCAGCSVEQYRDHVRRGRKWCTACKAWHQQTQFNRDRSRTDGLAARCRKGEHSFYRRRYVPKPLRRSSGTRRVAQRDGDRKQARRRVNYLVDIGVLPRPNSRLCVDCGHEWKSRARRHEYDHHLGYEAKHHEDVEVVCSRCHRKRQVASYKESAWAIQR